MRITATQINDWAKSIEARGSLPKLVRRLIHSVGSPLKASFPAGDSTNMSGWDGELEMESGNAWVPNESSFWEFSCNVNVSTKANSDYNKRTKETPKETRLTSTFLFVTARRWGTKTRWAQLKNERNEWGNVRAYDADDLEQWLEQSSAVALRFAEELGLIGQGVESIFRYWEGWSQQSEPTILANAFLVDREKTRERLIDNLRQKIQNGEPESYSIRADSVDEATAFVCASLLDNPDLFTNSLVVTEVGGWRYVEQNPSLKIAIAAKPEVAERPTRRNGLVVIIPYAAGDMGGCNGITGQECISDLKLERPRIYEFKKALESIGLDEGDASRLALSTGRSWSVFRRNRAINPALRRPVWLDAPQARVLSTLCLLGGWSGNSTDLDIAAYLANRPYEDVERDLRYLSHVNDSPVLEIGPAWKAKSPLELLNLFGGQITRDELERFFNVARQILIASDPVLELPEEERYAAQIHGKARPQSDFLIRSVCDTLIKLAVMGVHIPNLRSEDIDGRISSFVRELLLNADEIRWLSLSSFLPSLAESAPDAFLNSAEISLSLPGKPITRLLRETNSSGFFGGRCWHAGLLWALETLAWSPEFLARVMLLLSQLAHVEIKGNWGNTPKGTLFDIFRSWFPQTAANIEQRISMLDLLIQRDSEVAFDLLNHLVHVGHDTATPIARPKWRDYDVGAGHGATGDEQWKMLIAAADRLITCSKGNPYSIATLIEKLHSFDKGRIDATLVLIGEFAEQNVPDGDKEIIRVALRKEIHWQRNFGEIKGRALDNNLRPLEDLYEKLLPNDILIRYRWLFTDGWVVLPEWDRDNDYNKKAEQRESLRINALQEILTERGFRGVEELILACPNQSCIGYIIPKLDLKIDDLAGWITEKWNDQTLYNSFKITIAGLLHALKSPYSEELVMSVLNLSKKYEWNAEQTAGFLVLGRTEWVIWEIVKSFGPEIEKVYWEKVIPDYGLQDNKVDFEFVLHRLLLAGRPRTALQICQTEIKSMDANLLAEILEQVLYQEESNGPRLDSWHISEALKYLEESGVIERNRLIRLEFALIPALGFEEEKHAHVLYEAIMNDPKLFTELVCILYKPENSERGETVSETVKWAWRNAWNILRHCKRLPGTQHDGTISEQSFFKFIEEARELCKEADILTGCDTRLGEILAHAPVGEDGIWPFKPVIEILERPESENIRQSFRTGVFNKRGIFWRSPGEGGNQERNLASRYDKYAQALNTSYPTVAALLRSIARGYERDGRREDVEAKMESESY